MRSPTRNPTTESEHRVRHHHTGRGKPMKGIAIGIVVTIAGLALWLSTEEVENSVISLHKAGMILAIIGAAEALFALLALGKKTKK
ncbi:hypothetical protein TPA0598_02_06210 [Streptomyces lydicamycinicus]|uniref:Uncharacterized protein n=2 Tax=Streptomyces lydicamycinicus TaxID=1546107 RepID=A0A0P4R3J1_9ACTN|nr:hypothetical protein TPA0598_02_06210 [Streptomyces lydicamycinicus]